MHSPTKSGRPQKTAPQPTRRAFLGAAASAGAFLALGPRLPAAARATASAPRPLISRKLVLINLEGAYDALSLLPPLTGSAATKYRQIRPVLAVRPTVTGQPTPLVQPIALPGVSAFGLHPSLAPLVPDYQAGRMAFVKKVGLPAPQLSHFKAKDIMALGRSDTAGVPLSGWLGRTLVLNSLAPSEVLGIGVNSPLVLNTGVTGGTRPAVIASLSNFAINVFHGPTETALRRQVLSDMLQQAVPGEHRITAAARSATRSGMDLSELLVAAASGVTLQGNYGDPAAEPLAASLPDIARLIGAPSVPTKIFYTTSGEFDTHAFEEETGPANKPRLRDRLDRVVQAIAAFISDLKSPAISGWNDTAIVIYTEFGRRNAENQSRGTDHGHGFHAIVLGGSVLGGLKGNPVVANDLDAAAPYNNANLPVQIDYRTLFRKSLSDWLGLDGNAVFNDFTPAGSEPAFTLF